MQVRGIFIIEMYNGRIWCSFAQTKIIQREAMNIPL